MCLDRGHQVGCSSVVQEENPLAEAPQRRASKLSRAGLSLADSISKSVAHVVQEEVGEQVDGLIAKRFDRGVTGREAGRVAERTADGPEEIPAAGNGAGAARRVGGRR